MSNSRSLTDLGADHLSVLDDAIRTLGRGASAKLVDQDWALGTITWKKSLGHPVGNPVRAFNIKALHEQIEIDALTLHEIHLLVPHQVKMWDATKPEDDSVHLDFIVANVTGDEGAPHRRVYSVEVEMLPGDWPGDTLPALRRLWPPSHAFTKGNDPFWIQPFTVKHMKPVEL
jgi:hypothetical protein